MYIISEQVRISSTQLAAPDLGAGASGAEVMEIMSGSRMGIIPKVMFLLLVS